MSFSESPSAELERRLRSINPQETSAEDALIVEIAGRLAPTRLQAVSQPGPTVIKPMQPLELMMKRSSTDEMLGDPSETANVEVEAGQTLNFDDFVFTRSERGRARGEKRFRRLESQAFGSRARIHCDD